MFRKIIFFCLLFVIAFAVFGIVLELNFPGAGFEALADPIGNHGGPF